MRLLKRIWCNDARPQNAHDVDFICRHCGAQYVVSYTKLPIADSGSAYCEVCKRRMVQWNSALQPFYRLVKRPDRPDQWPI